MELLGRFLLVFTMVFFLTSPPLMGGEKGEGVITPSGLQRPEGVKAAPPFTLKDLEGGVKGLSDFRGHVILLHFWATWCVPCKDELPTIKALWERLKDKGFVVVAIAVDNKKAVESFVKEYSLGFPVLIDQYGSTMRSYRVRALPTTYVIGKTDEMEGVAIGPRDWTDAGMMGLIEGLLKE